MGLCYEKENPIRYDVFNNLLIFQDIIYNIKKTFNSEFDAAYKQKEIEIARVQEKNVRIAEIISDLELEEKVWQPVFEDSEKPERALVVEDDEVKASRLIPSHLIPRSIGPAPARPAPSLCTIGSSCTRQPRVPRNSQRWPSLNHRVVSFINPTDPGTIETPNLEGAGTQGRAVVGVSRGLSSALVYVSVQFNLLWKCPFCTSSAKEQSSLSSNSRSPKKQPLGQNRHYK